MVKNTKFLPTPDLIWIKYLKTMNGNLSNIKNITENYDMYKKLYITNTKTVDFVNNYIQKENNKIVKEWEGFEKRSHNLYISPIKIQQFYRKYKAYSKYKCIKNLVNQLQMVFRMYSAKKILIFRRKNTRST